MADIRDANENPWYVLMTLYGEQDEDWVNPFLLRRNVTAWNAWSCQNLTEEERAALRARGAEAPDAGAWARMEAEVRDALERRNNTDLAYEDLPEVGRKVFLRGKVFPSKLLMEKAIFLQACHFEAATFIEYVDFTSAVFMRGAYFGSARFSQGATFDYVTFAQIADFSSATFVQDASFFSATFTQDAYFRSATFSQNTDFTSTTFLQGASLRSATFAQGAYFDFTTFTCHTDFTSTKFPQGTSFGSATFKQTVNFIAATFPQGASFDAATFQGRAFFIKARFGAADDPQPSVLNLTDAQFEKPVSFRDVVFLTRYPDFTGAVVEDKSSFPWDAENWPSKKEHDPKSGRASCAFLRHHMSKQGMSEAEQFFHRREMELAARSGPWLTRCMFWLYGVLSDFGTSVWRPMIALFFVWLCAIPAFLFNDMGVFSGVLESAMHQKMSIGDAAGISGANIFNFLGFQRAYFGFEFTRNLPAPLKVVAALQTIAGLVFLFFLGLGLRSRFRLR